MKARVITAILVMIAVIIGLMFFPFGFGTESVRIIQARRTSPNTVSLGIDSCNNSARVASAELDGDKIFVEVVHPRQNDSLDCAETIGIDVPENVTVVVDRSSSEEIDIEPEPVG